MNLTDFVRPEVRALSPYELELEDCPFKLDQNEMPWDLPARIKAHIAEELLARDWARYPDFHADALRAAIASRIGWHLGGVLVGNGSNELLALALEAFSRPGGEVLGVLPSFALYRMFTVRAAARTKFLGPRADLRLPLAELAAEIDADPTRPVVLCSPNNPTGESIPPEEVANLAAKLQAPLLLDNAYGEFGCHDYRPLLERCPNLVIFKTFSKAWSLGGLRVGYLLAQPEVVTELIKIKLPYNLGHAGAIAARVVLAEERVAACRVRAVVRLRRAWSARLSAFPGLTVLPSEGNFLIARFAGGDDAAGRVFTELARRGIRVRDVRRAPGLAGCLRFSVGSARALVATEAALTTILGPEEAAP